MNYRVTRQANNKLFFYFIYYVIQNAIIRFAPQFEGSEQHDSQEFLNFLLDGLHEDLNVVQRRPPPTPEDPDQDAWFEKLPDWEASGIAWEKYLKRNSSVIVSLFQGQFRNRLQCMTCHTTSTTYNSFMTLSLPIPASRRGPSQVTLQQCIDYFVREEILEKDDAWYVGHKTVEAGDLLISNRYHISL